MAQETNAVMDSLQMTLTDKDSSLTEELYSVRIERANLCADLDEMTELLPQMKDDIEKS